jgi:hypothetical protein
MKPEVILKLKEQFKAEMAAYMAYNAMIDMIGISYARHFGFGTERNFNGGSQRLVCLVFQFAHFKFPFAV